MSKPTLPDGLVAVVKRDCATCQMVVPVLQALAATETLTVYTQDDPEFPGDPAATYDADLGVSWHHDIETVPTLIRVVDGVETDRTFGWSQPAWREFTGIDDLGEGLPVMRPGCGSKSLDPDLVDELRARHGGSILRSRRIEVAEAEDDLEMMFTRGWTDGLPVVPPTEARVLAMLEGTARPPDEIVATVPPDLVDVTVEKVAISAVMAGCKPEYLPWVLTAVEAMLSGTGTLSGELVEAAFADMHSPGRLEVVRASPTVLVDAAHNPHGVDALVAGVQEAFSFERLVGVVGILQDKDAESILSGLESLLDEVVVTRSGSPRAHDVADLAEVAREVFGEDRVHTAERLDEAIAMAVELSEAAVEGSPTGAGVLVTGSVTMAAEARTLFGRP